MTTNWKRLIPIILILLYLYFTVILFAYGPWPYPVENSTLLYFFLNLAHLSLLLGYLSGAWSAPRDYYYSISIKTLFYFSTIVSLSMFMPTSLSRTGNWIPAVAIGLEDPGKVYTDTQYLISANNFNVVEYVRIFLGPIMFISFPILVFYWKKLNTLQHIFGSLNVLGIIFLYIAMGTNKEIAKIVIILPILLTASYLANILTIKKKKLIIMFIFCVICFFGFLNFYTKTQLTRTGTPAKHMYFPQIDMHADPENIFVRILPENYQIGMIGLSSYLTQGYYALDLALQEPFIPMFGVGNSMFLSRQVSRLLINTNLEDFSYPARIERYGWDSEHLWSSIYTWLASDFSFVGTIFIVFIIGRLFALSWIDTLRGNNPFAVVIFSYFTLMLFYFPANNIVMQDGESLFSFFVIFLFWIFSSKRIRLGSFIKKPHKSF